MPGLSRSGWLRRAVLIVAACTATPAAVQPVATSPKPEAVSVTIYRSPYRPASQAMNLNWLNGYALITETRQVSIPAGEGELRFEGVAAGIIPESAIVTGLPNGVVEKNQDAYLLSPGSLLAQSLGRRVTIRRTSAQGDVREHEAVIRSGPDGAVVLQTEDGFEALRCTGFNETIVYPSIPEGLSAKPTLSVRTRSERAATATVTLSYLASGFDWQANYVATLAPSGDRLDLFAWVTLANGDETSFVDASAQAIAGTVKREAYRPGVRPQKEGLNLRCWPAATTSDIVSRRDFAGGPPPPPPPPPPPSAPAMAEQIVVTGSRVRKAELEELGDLKLYRIPDRVTVASNSQKQVAMLDKPGVKVTTLYRLPLFAPEADQRFRPMRVLRTRNRTAEGLGLPLPAGQVVLFGAGRERPILLGEGFVEDKAVGEDVEIEVAEAVGIHARITQLPGSTEQGKELELVVTNDHDRPVPLEAELTRGGWIVESKTKLDRRNGEPLWVTTIPANGRVTLRYRVTQP